MREDILNYEKRLIEDRQKLLELTAQCSRDNSPITRDKLNYFNTELMYMNNQLNMLKNELAKAQSEKPSAPVRTQTEQVHINEAQTTVQVPPEIVKNTDKPRIQEAVQSATEPSREPVQKEEAKKRDFEKAVGKSLMGIFASVLIFISLILFSTLLLPYLTDTIKMIITYIISFGFIGFGMFKLKKDKDNKFYLSLTGCGVGALYVSILLTNFYFKAVGDITLYIMIALWAVFVCWLSRLKNSVFQIIGHAGILIAMIFGSVLCVDNNDAVKFLVLIIFYAVTSTIFYISHFNKEFWGNIIHHIFNVLNLIVICIAYGEIGIYYDIINADCDYLAIVISLILLAHIIIVFCNEWKKAKFSIGIVMSIYTIMFISIIISFIYNEFILCFTIYILSMAISVLTEFKKSDFVHGKRIIQAVMLLLSFMSIYDSVLITISFCIPLIILPVFVLGFLRSNSVYKYGSVLLLLVYFVLDDVNFAINYIEKTVWGLATLSVMYFSAYKFKERYSYAFNTVLHITSILYMLLAVNEGLYVLTDSRDISDALIFIIIAIFNVAMMKSVFAKNLITGEYESSIVYKIINSINMIAGLALISTTDNIAFHLLVILVSLAIFMLNTKNLLDRYKNIIAGFYVGLKLTVLIVVILNSFDAANYIVSVACFIFAIAAIIIGFKADYKSLRIYGLILSMLSIFKLVMIDIHYANTLGNAISFFVSGILCFAISMIYNYIDKKLVNKSRNDTDINI